MAQESSIDSKQIRGYLLGQLSQSESDRMDELCFIDDEFSNRLLIIEDDLIDAYVRGQLPDVDRKNFEIKYLAVHRLRDRVGFADALKQSASSKAQSPGSLVRDQASWPQRFSGAFSWELIAAHPILTVVIVALIISVAWIYLSTSFQRREEPKLVGPLTLPTTAVSASPSPPSSFPTATPLILPSPILIEPKPAIFVLSPGVRDVAASRSFALPGNSKEIILRLELEGERYDRYQAILITARDETQVWQSGKLRPTRGSRRNFLDVAILTSILASRTYILALNGSRGNQREEEVGEYSFRILQ